MSELDPVIKTIIAEGANQDDAGMHAIASVIVNRAKRRNKSFEDIVNQPKQFTGRWRKDLDSFVAKQGPEVAQRAIEAFNKAQEEPITGVDHYMTNSLFESSKRPSWGSKMGGKKVIGDHTFLDSKVPGGGAKLMPAQGSNSQKEQLFRVFQNMKMAGFSSLTPEELAQLAAKMFGQGQQAPTQPQAAPQGGLV